MNIRAKDTAIDALVKLEESHLMRAKEIRSVINELQSQQGGMVASHYDRDMSLPQKIEYVLGEAGVYLKLYEVAEAIAHKEELDDLTALKAQISKRLNKLKNEGRLKNKRTGASLHDTRWGLIEWG